MPGGMSHQCRRMKAGLARAGLDPTATFYARRHSHIRRAIEGGVPLNVSAENCGTSVRMIETTYAKVIASKRRELIAKGDHHSAPIDRSGCVGLLGG